MPIPLYVFQDGADFYVCADGAGTAVKRIAKAPFPVADGDLSDAIEARAWFEDNGYFKGGEADRVVYI